jgi:hypothetical protein
VSIGNSFKLKNTHYFFHKGAKKRRDYYILQKYDVLTMAEKKYLIHKKTDDKDDIK